MDITMKVLLTMINKFHFEMRKHVPFVPSVPTKLLTLYKSISYIEIILIKWLEHVGIGRNTLEQQNMFLRWLEQKSAYTAKFSTVGTKGTKGTKYIYLKIIWLWYIRIE